MNVVKRFFSGRGRVLTSNHSALVSFLRRRVSHAWDVRDLAQEVYVRMLQIDEERANEISNPRAYMFTVASNLIKERAVLQRRRALDVDIEQVFPDIEALDGSPVDEAELALRRRHVAAMLERLPARYKAVLLMQHRDGMSYDEIAKHFGVSTHMVKKYVVKALVLCRQDLAGREEA